jgi:hypothetical protein
MTFSDLKTLWDSFAEWRQSGRAKNIKEGARLLRRFAARQFNINPTAQCYPKAILQKQLEGHGVLIDDVLELMQKEGWARPHAIIADCWEIDRFRSHEKAEGW